MSSQRFAMVSPCFNVVHINDIDASFFPITVNFQSWDQRRPGIYIAAPGSTPQPVTYPALDSSAMPVSAVEIFFSPQTTVIPPNAGGYHMDPGSYPVKLNNSVDVTILITGDPNETPDGKYIKIVLANPAEPGA